MWSWLKQLFVSNVRPSAPATEEEHPRLGHEVTVGFANGERSWSEAVNLLDVAARVLGARGYDVTRGPAELRLESAGLELRPTFSEISPIEPSGVSTCTIVHLIHPHLPHDPAFEYQHATGETIDASAEAGLEAWAETDLVVVLDMFEVEPRHCTTLKVGFPASAGSPERTRRVIYGPAKWVQAEPVPDVHGEHPNRCVCCILTNTWESFRALVEGNGVYAIRLFALRDADGLPQADCRVNGRDFEPGRAALLRYVETWPARGFEFRKQYVIVHTPASVE